MFTVKMEIEPIYLVLLLKYLRFEGVKKISTLKEMETFSF